VINRMLARPSNTARWLTARPWTHVKLPQEVRRFPSMLYEDERRLLFLLGQKFRGIGQIVDAGCFAGGSTFALASGLDTNRRWRRDRPRVIHSYDLFTVDEWTKSAHADLLDDVEAGASLRPKFDRLLASYAAYLDVHEGDICDIEWNGDPIEVLFIDVSKTWEINDHVVRQFFPALVPNESVVVQQDFVHEWLPHIPLTMGLLADAFEFAGFVAPSSALFVPTRRIDSAEIPRSLKAEISDKDKLAYFDRACVPFTGEEKAILDCARAVLVQQLGSPSEAVEILNTIPVGLSERVATSVNETRGWLLRSHPDPAISIPAWERWHALRGT
jgi:hypothetical protein